MSDTPPPPFGRRPEPAAADPRAQPAAGPAAERSRRRPLPADPYGRAASRSPTAPRTPRLRPDRAGPPAGDDRADPRDPRPRRLRRRRAVRLGDGQPGGPRDRRQQRPARRPLATPTPAGSAASSAPILIGAGPPVRRRRWSIVAVVGTATSAPATEQWTSGVRRPPARTTASPRTAGGCGRCCRYSRRGSRFTPSQAAAWEAHHERWVIPDEAVDEPGLPTSRRGSAARRRWSSRSARASARRRRPWRPARPDHDVLALEVWRPGVADTLWRLAEAGADERAADAASTRSGSLEHLVDAGRAGRAVDVLPRPVAQDPAPQAPARRRRASRALAASPAGARAPRGGWPRTGRTTPSRCATVLDAEPLARGRAGAAVGGAAGHPVRAQGRRGRSRHHRPGLPRR